MVSNSKFKSDLPSDSNLLVQEFKAYLWANIEKKIFIKLKISGGICMVSAKIQNGRHAEAIKIVS